MQIPGYQMRNVLNTYSRQLSQTKASTQKIKFNRQLPVDQIDLSIEGKKKATIEKAASDILVRITQINPKDELTANAKAPVAEAEDPNDAPPDPQSTDFVFNVIDGGNRKTTNSVSVDDTEYLIERLEQKAKQHIEGNE